MSDPERDELVARARARLDQDVEALDETTRARLRAARLRALAALDASPAAAVPRGLLAAAAGVGALLLLLTNPWRRSEPAPSFAEALDDVEILSAADDLELYDDLEFYRWLAESEAS